ncbi:MAG: hypothetical protein ACYC6Y_17795, partial [Thermoguttaceae bacterium]
TLADALAESRRLSLSAQMHDAGRAVDENRMGQAVADQQRVVEGLQRVLDILGNRRQNELGALARRLQQAEKQLAELERRQGELQGEMQKAAAIDDAQERRRRLEQLRAEQDAVRTETEQAARQLEGLSASQAAQTAREAQKSMQQSSDSAGNDKAQESASQADDARKKLQQAREQLAEQRRQVEAELALEQLGQLEESLKALRRRQQAALEGTQRLAQSQSENSGLTDSQRATLTALAGEQALLQAETGQIHDNLTSAAVLQLVLSQTVDDMAAAHASLVQEVTGPPTQQPQRSALARLDQIVEALAPVEPAEDDSPTDGANGQGQDQGAKPPQSPGDALKAMAELKLLKLMQVGLNARTQTLERQYGAGETVPEEARREYARLGREQGHLADLLLALMQEMEAPEDEPGPLPGPSPKSPNFDMEETP